MYALDLMNENALRNITKDNPDVYPKSEFVSYLMEQFMNEIDPSEASDGDIVIYFCNKKPKHAGKFHSGYIISKWGIQSHLWRHGLYEVPISYGNEVRFFGKLKPNAYMNGFKMWADNILLPKL